MSAPPLFEIAASWRALGGPVLGLSQPALIGVVRVRMPVDYDFAGLDHYIAGGVEEPVPHSAEDADAGRRLVLRAAHWSGAAQRQHKIAVSDRIVLGAPSADPEVDGATRFPVALSSLSHDASIAALSWVTRAVGRYLAEPSTARLGEDDRDALRQTLERFGLPGINSFRFLRAADELGIPVSPVSHSVFQYGIGRRSRWLASSIIDTTGNLAFHIANSKSATATVLRRAGLPAPVHARAADADEAARKAVELGYPVVVKPDDKDRGEGVAAGLPDEAAVRAAFAAARKFSAHVLVEKHVDGSDFRLTVFEGRVVQVIGRRPGGVVGDGRHSLTELVALEAATPEARRRQRDHNMPPVSLDAEALDLAREQALEPDSVVDEGRFVRLRRRANVSTGGVPSSIPLDEVHPDNLALAVDAAASLRLNMAGVDLIAPEIGRSWMETGALICEVNAQPQISRTGSAEIYADILRALLGKAHTIPIWVYVARQPPGEPPAVPVRECPAVGYSCAAGVWLSGRRVAGPQGDSVAAARALLSYADLDSAIVHLTPEDVVAKGLPAPILAAAGVDADALANRQAMAYLLPHVRGTLVLPAGSAHDPVTRQHKTATRDDPWTALVAAALRDAAGGGEGTAGRN
jgi:cyanophycin synthetase